MKIFVFEGLRDNGLIEEDTLQTIISKEKDKPVNLFVELKLLFYAGILLLTTGLGIIIYKNIDSIGHLNILLSIAASTVFCFVYCFLKAPGFSWSKPPETNLLNDYILLTGCLLMLILTAYLQFQYLLFGEQFGLATFIPMVILFACAYYFDHLGILSMAITNLAAWAGLTVTPKELLRNNDFNNATLIYTCIALGVFLLLISYLSSKNKLKIHFSFTYKNFGIHILLIGLNAALIHFNNFEWLWLLLLVAVCFWQFRTSIAEKSFYFFIIVFLYLYFGCSYAIIHNVLRLSLNDGTLYIILLYFIFSAVLSVYLLMKFNKKMKSNDNLQ